MTDYATLLSLLLTPATVIVGLVVLREWGRPALEAATAVRRSQVQWLILGVAIGFVGSVADNVYWGIAWSLEYLGARNPLFEAGAWSNVPFRQGCGIAAGLCHIRAAITLDDARMRRVGIVSCLAGLTFVGALVALR